MTTAPQSRLLWLTAVTVTPSCTLVTASDTYGIIGWAVLAAFVVTVILDWALSINRLDDVMAKLPEVTWHTQDRESGLDLEIAVKQPPTLDRRIRVGLALPSEFVSRAEDFMAVIPAGAAQARFAWQMTPKRRGKFVVDRCHMEAVSSLGLWAIRRTVPVKAELRVYPNLLTERNDLAALFLNRGMMGIHAQRQVGKGRDFEKLREYIAGDNYEDIHWKATAKRGHPVTKIFQVERTQEVYVILDASRLSGRVVDMGRGTAETSEEGSESRVTVLERYVTAALILGLAAERQGDLFGLLTFSDTVENFVRARNGKAHYRACRDALYTLQPRAVTPDFDEMAAFVRTRLRRRALLVFMTALDDPMLAETFLRNMDIVCRQHLVLVNVLRPSWARPVFAGGEVATVDEVYQRLGGHMFWHDLRELEKQLQHRGVQFAQLENEKLCAQVVTEYLNVKQRQLL
jgi:uncharacterized protein (DUF58 family)